MPKKIIYYHKEMGNLFVEYIREKYPNYEDALNKFRFLTDVEQNTIFLEICNKYGEDGWIINPIPYSTKSGRLFYLMYKEVYYNKKDKEKKNE